MRKYYAQGVSLQIRILCVLMLGLSAWASAGEVTYLPNDASHCEMVLVLSGRLPRECLVKRTIVRTTNAGKAQAAVTDGDGTAGRQRAAATPIAPESPPSEWRLDGERVGTSAGAAPGRSNILAMTIPFEFDSDRLKPGALPILDQVAYSFQHEYLRDHTVALNGHADAVGSASYNLRLSQRRAYAVQRYLHEQHGIPLHRIPARGKGETAPLNALDPQASINRRVEFEPLGRVSEHASAR